MTLSNKLSNTPMPTNKEIPEKYNKQCKECVISKHHLKTLRLSVMYPGRLRDRYTGLGAQTLARKKTLQVFFFQLYFIKKYIDVAINDFTKHLIISKWLKNKNNDRREKQVYTC